MPEIYIAQFIVFIMILLRVASALVVAPVFGDKVVPAEIKIGIAFYTSFILFPIVSHKTPVLDLQMGVLVLCAIKEVLLGILLGFTLSLLFAGVRYAGELISYTMGISMANILDPENSMQTPVIGEMLYLVTILLFLVINGHHFVIESLVMTFQAIPIGMASLSVPLLSLLIKVSGLMFVVAVKIAAPVLTAGFLTNLGLSILARVMPQANIFIVGFPITITVGVMVLISAAPFLVVTFKKLLTVFESNIVEIVRTM